VPSRKPANASNIAMIALLLALLAGCSTTVVRAPPAPAPVPSPDDQVQAQQDRHWQFDDAVRPAAEPDGYRPPVHLAVLLPLSGDLSRAAVPVRDGLLSAYYAEHRRRPELTFYDTAGTPGGTLAAYDEAVAAGADFVLGPLGRDEVGALFAQGPLQVPVLALNRGSTPPPPGSASFSLAPEDDGIAAAGYLLARNARRVLVLAGPDDGMRRAVAAFGDALRAQDGQVAAELTMYTAETDLSAALAAAAAAPGGVDAVFMALAPGRIRAVLPQLQAAGLRDRPKVATSQLSSATPAEASRLDYTAEHALDGIAFPTQRWATRGIASLPSAESAAELLASARGPAARLFAFGHDAWLLTAYLELLATEPGASVPGATGALGVDAAGNVLRAPAWSTWSGDTVVPLANAGG
jgi:outer membrane PBP1 activator LpoA protein